MATMKFRLPRWTLVLSFISFSFINPAIALEIEPYMGLLNYQRVDGCCQSTGSRLGTGLKIQVTDFKNQNWHLLGYSDRRWSEFVIEKPRYLIGDASTKDPIFNEGVSSIRIRTWSIFYSPGLGFFSHTTKTVKFDLPAISSGFSVNSSLTSRYAINDQWAIDGIVRLGVAFASDDTGLLSGLYLGFNYRP